ncbi:hypothetical protein J2Y69_003115 [Microbacterium resistens]|uniref:Uncharacterized protein n=1 Tax=Microbacterium resistens TaxID=156977 RepID=A0ABU1SFW5_9MICO|nr:hypothetical protein [Microbacterium resistens]MDR6868496.1 hypothetical protein [Microbacterium resistens]
MNAHDETGTYRESIRATVRLVLWGLVWLVTLAAARFGPETLWDSGRLPVASWVAVILNVLVGIVWIVAFTRFLRTLDDLQRKIMQDALAVTLGAGWVMGFAYVVADKAGLIRYDLDLALFPVLLGVVYLIAFVVGRIRYR